MRTCRICLVIDDYPTDGVVYDRDNEDQTFSARQATVTVDPVVQRNRARIFLPGDPVDPKWTRA